MTRRHSLYREQAGEALEWLESTGFALRPAAGRRVENTGSHAESNSVYEWLTGRAQDLRAYQPQPRGFHAGRARRMGEGGDEEVIKVKDIGGLGDLLELDLKKLTDDGPHNFLVVSVTGGRIPDAIYKEKIYSGSGKASLDNVKQAAGSVWATGVVHIAPDITPRITPQVDDSGNMVFGHKEGTTVTVEYSYEDGYDAGRHDERHTRTVEIEVGKGASAFKLGGPVGAKGKVEKLNDALDVARVQQRLRYLNYPSRSTCGGIPMCHGDPCDSTPEYVPTVVNGNADLKLIQAIKLFQASISDGNPADKDGRVDVNGPTHKWLNARNAPHWLMLPEKYRRANSINHEYWGTSWVLKIIETATGNRSGLLSRVTSLSEYPDINFTHGTHKAGMDIDWDIEEGGIPNQGRMDGSPTATAIYNQLDANAKAVVNDIKAIHAAAGTLFKRVLVGGSKDDGQNTYPLIRQYLTAIGINNKNLINHHHHIHVDINPPARDPL